jgi:hypothetical protein
MSNHHAKQRRKEWSGGKQIMALLAAAIVIAMIAFPLYRHYAVERFDRPWPSVTGHVLETRVVVVGMRDRATDLV